MDKARKMRIKKIMGLAVAAAVVIGLAAMPLLAKQTDTGDGPQASILSGTAQTQDLAVSLTGGGALTQQDAVSVSVHNAVKLTRFLVNNGDSVKAGDPLAEADRVSVMTAIAQVQQTLDYLAEELEAAAEEASDGEVVAQAGGTVKQLYAQEGDSVQNVMLEHGALAVLSLDGLMAVDLETAKEAPVGAEVTLIFEDDTTAEGVIRTSLAGDVTVTVKDNDYAAGQKVIVTLDGTRLGSGKLYIYSPWNAVAYTGTVEDINVKEGEAVDAGDALMELSGAGQTGTYRQLLNQRQKYEELMQALFVMYQTRQVTAPCDGVVSGVDENSVQLLSDQSDGCQLVLLANAPNGDDETQYTNYIGQVTGIEGSSWTLNINPQPVSVTDYKNLTGVPMDTAAMTQAVSFDPASTNVPVYTLSQDQWTQIGVDTVEAGEILLFAGNADGSFVWIVRVGSAELPLQPEEPTVPGEPSEPTEPSEPSEPGEPGEPTTPTDPSTPADPATPSEPVIPTDPSTPTEPSDPSTPTTPEGNKTPSAPSGSSNGGFTYPSGGTAVYPSTGSSQAVIPQQEEKFELYNADMTQIAAVTPQDTMKLEITVDEQDILQLRAGMPARVVIDALGGQNFDAVISDIANTGSNSGGSSKFTVELTLDREENMLSGMNATAAITLDTAENVLTIPAEALVEQGTKTLVYTGYDGEAQLLTDPVEVSTGLSDGIYCQILSGLSDGSMFYYAYYDTLEISNAPDFGNAGLFR